MKLFDVILVFGTTILAIFKKNDERSLVHADDNACDNACKVQKRRLNRKYNSGLVRPIYWPLKENDDG